MISGVQGGQRHSSEVKQYAVANEIPMLLQNGVLLIASPS